MSASSWAFVDYLARRPEMAMSAIRTEPAASGSLFFDNLLAGETLTGLLLEET